MSNRTISIISFITIIGWIVGFILYNNKSENEKDESTPFHLRQSFGLMVLSSILSVFGSYLFFGSGLVLNAAYIGLLVLWIVGISNVLNNNNRPLPLLGDFFDRTFSFIK